MLSNRAPVIDHRPYRRWIEGSGLSLEADTPSTALAGVYYVLQEGVACFSSDDLGAAREEFDRLGVIHWEALLTSPDPQQRLDGAGGLLHHDRAHGRAIAVLSAEGDDRDRHRIAKARHRAQYEMRRGLHNEVC